MERKCRSCSPPVQSPLMASGIFCDHGKGSSASPTPRQSESGRFSSVFPPENPEFVSSVPQPELGGGVPDIFGQLLKKPETPNPSWNAQNTTDGKYGYDTDMEHRGINKDTVSIFQNERIAPCTLSNSLYYGGQDIFVPPSTKYSKKIDYEDDPANSHFASRGNWWQGSLYY